MKDGMKLDGKDPWDSCRFFLGKWIDTGSGDPGESTIDRE